MKLYAISDLHLEHEITRTALTRLPEFKEDWLILAGDICNGTKYLRYAFEVLSAKFQKLIWVPGNHELWVETKEGRELKGEEKYFCLIDLCREYGVLNPEDPYVTWQGEGLPCTLAPLFLLYDYSFRPPEISRNQAVDWAAETKVVCTDEYYLSPIPYESRDAWCEARLKLTEPRLAEVSPEHPLVIINHFPLREELVRLRRIPRFSLWCGTKATEDWHLRFPTYVAVSGHLHIRATDYRNGVRFEEVSLGYPQHWDVNQPLESYLREILPGPLERLEHGGPFWRNYH